MTTPNELGFDAAVSLAEAERHIKQAQLSLDAKHWYSAIIAVGHAGTALFRASAEVARIQGNHQRKDAEN